MLKEGTVPKLLKKEFACDHIIVQIVSGCVPGTCSADPNSKEIYTDLALLERMNLNMDWEMDVDPDQQWAEILYPDPGDKFN